MSNTFLIALSIFGIVYLGWPSLKVLPILAKLCWGFLSGKVSWPGPEIHGPNPNADFARIKLGGRVEHLFPAYLRNALGLLGAIFVVATTCLSLTPILAPYIRFTNLWVEFIFTMFVLIAGGIAKEQLSFYSPRMNVFLADLDSPGEPREADVRSRDDVFAIPHPLIHRGAPNSNAGKALALYYEAVCFHRDGLEQKAQLLDDEARELDPALHEHACEALLQIAEGCPAEETGPVNYWLGIHWENRMDWGKAKTYFEKAIQSFNAIGYSKREARAHCNLGSILMRMRDPKGMDEFETAVRLDPQNGTANINIGLVYYRISEPGDSRHERSLDSFAAAIAADPVLYGPQVIGYMRQIGYTWKEDMKKITERLEHRELEEKKNPSR